METKLEGNARELKQVIQVIKEFLVPWKKNREVLGALLVGSYAAGLQTPRSDIDICIILANTVKYWKRGDVMISNFLVEYAAYPISYLKEIQAKDLKGRKRLRTRMLATGKILFDKTGAIRKLKKRSKKLIKKKLPRQNAEVTELNKYYLWDQLDNLCELARKHAVGFEYAYHTGLQNIIEFYADFLGLEIPRPTRIHSFITNSDFRKRYCIARIPDKVFTKLFAEALSKRSLQKFEELTVHVQKQMGGFCINGWHLRRHTTRRVSTKT